MDGILDTTTRVLANGTLVDFPDETSIAGKFTYIYYKL